MRPFLLALAVAFGPLAHGQTLTIPDSTPDKPIIAKVQGMPDGSKVGWQADSGSSVVKAGPNRAYFWATVGQHVGHAVVAPPGDGELVWLTAVYKVSETPPTPEPAKTLRDYVTGEQAAKLSTLYAALAQRVVPGSIDSAAVFNDVQQSQLESLGLVGHGATAEVAKRLDPLMAKFNLQAVRNELEKISLEFGTPTPTPVPPGPTPPGPTPPGPTPPSPGPPPIAEAGLRVLIVEETDDRDELPKSKLDQLTSTAPGSVRDYCAAHCIKPDGKNPDFLELDDDQPDLSKLPAYWTPAWNRRPRTSDNLPWLVVSDGKAGFEGPLPATAADTLKILTAVGGP